MDASVQLTVAAVVLVRCIETLLGAVKLPVTDAAVDTGIVTGEAVITDTIFDLGDVKLPFTATT